MRLLPFLALPLASAADGQQVPLVPPTAPTAAMTPTPAAATTVPDEGTLIALGEIQLRLTVPVELGAAGPYPFIIDTGAERTVVARELARILALQPGPEVNLTTMTGRTRVGTVVVPDLIIPAIGQRHRIEAPALNARDLGAAGLLGIDTLADHQVSIDFDAGTMAVLPSVRRKPHEHRDPDEIVVQAKSLFGQLIVTDAYVNGSRVRVVIDTGSQVSMGNSKLRSRVQPRDPLRVQLTSVTGETTAVDYTLVPKVQIGDVQFDVLPVAFADVAPFERFGLTKQPALLLGMDALRSFRRVEIDFPNRQVRFLMPKTKAVDRRRFTGSRIPGFSGGAPVVSF